MTRQRFVLSITPVVNEDGSTAEFLFSPDSWCTAPTDTPPNKPVPGLLRNPGTLRRELFQGQGVTGAIAPSFGAVELANPAPDATAAGELDDWIDYGVAGATVTLRWGPVGGAYPGDYTTVYIARGHSFVADADTITIRLRDDLQLLDQPVITDGFAGTGGIEGYGAVAKRKQFVAGDPGFIVPILVDPIKQIYYVQSTGTGGLDDSWKTNTGVEVNAFDVFVNGVEVTRSATDYSSAAEMLSTPPAEGFVRYWFGPDSATLPGYKDGPVYFRLVGSISGDVRVFAYGSPQDADTARLGTPRASFNASLLALRAGVAPGNIGSGASFSVVAQLVDDSTTVLDLLTDQAKNLQAWFGFDRLGIFRSGFLLDPASTSAYYGTTPGLLSSTPPADSVSVYTFTERDIRGLRREPPAGLDVPVWSVAVTAGQTWPSQIAGGASDTLRDALQRQVWSSFSGVAAGTKLRDPGAVHVDVEIKSRLIQSAQDMRLWLERFLALYGGQRHFYSFTTPLSDDLLALDLHHCVTLQHRRFGLDAGAKFRIVSITIDCAAPVPVMQFVLWGGTPGRYTGGSSSSTPSGGGGGSGGSGGSGDGGTFVSPLLSLASIGLFTGTMFGTSSVEGASIGTIDDFTGEASGQALTDPYFADVILLVQGGTPASGELQDLSTYGDTITINNYADWSSAQTRFGENTLLTTTIHAGIDSLSSVGVASRFGRATGDKFTIECWVYLDTLENFASSSYFFRWSHSSGNIMDLGTYGNAAPSKLRIRNGADAPIESVNISKGAWHFVQVNIDGSSYTVDLDGTEVYSGTNNYNIDNTGTFYFNAASFNATGSSSGPATLVYQAPLRVTKGVLRARGSVPTGLFPTS